MISKRMGDLMKKFLILCVFVVLSAINFAAWADDNLNAKQCHSEWKDDWLLEVYFDNAQHSFPTIGDDKCEDKVKEALKAKMGNEAKGKYILIASTSRSGPDPVNQKLAENRKKTVAKLITDNFLHHAKQVASKVFTVFGSTTFTKFSQRLNALLEIIDIGTNRTVEVYNKYRKGYKYNLPKGLDVVDNSTLSAAGA